MSPNSLNQNQPSTPASLPPVAVSAGQPQPIMSPQPHLQQHVEAADVTGRVVAEAKRLADQYTNDPYHLSEALGQLKAAYLVQKYNLDINNQSTER